ncbi:hypothetical protein DL93DRAFT_2074553 [Clavulina sp. PMI_390]|nr:hypothetical protein DL93DRAFT_2074553 [Clavulina sp. PMI_390]
MSQDSPIYKQPLLSKSSLDDVENVPDYSPIDERALAASNRNRKTQRLLLIVSGLLNITLFIAVAAMRSRVMNSVSWKGARPVWTPANHVTEHVYVRFPDIHDITPFKGPPTDAVDKAWEDLYQFGVSGIPRSMAAKLEGPTVKFYNDQEHYAVLMDVFHQLHCLNALRKSLYPERYPKNNMTFSGGIDHVEHLDHCVNSIRESLMCNADTTPNRWDWNPDARVSDPHFTNVHTCKNWNLISDYAKSISAKTTFDRWHFAPDDLKYPEHRYENVIEDYSSIDLYAFHNYDWSYLDKIRPAD